SASRAGRSSISAVRMQKKNRPATSTGASSPRRRLNRSWIRSRISRQPLDTPIPSSRRKPGSIFAVEQSTFRKSIQQDDACHSERSEESASDQAEQPQKQIPRCARNDITITAVASGEHRHQFGLLLLV